MTLENRELSPTGPMDFREWVYELERTGNLVRIEDEIDPLEEAGAIMRFANEKRSPAQWFTNLKDSMPGSSLLGGPFAAKERIAMAFGLPPNIGFKELTDIFAEFLEKGSVKPIVVDSGRCQENVLLGDEINLYKFPVPKLHPQDGGLYIGTLNIGVCKDYDSDWINWGNYRGMMQDKQSIGVFLGPLNHGGQILKKWHDNGRSMEFAMFFGGDPMHNIVASSSIPWGISEPDVVGSIRGEPVKLAKCRTIDLYVPENAEIVLEGIIAPGDLKEEGPFGEYPGYVVSGKNLRPVLRL